MVFAAARVGGRNTCNIPAKHADGVGSEVGSDSAMPFRTCWSWGEESIKQFLVLSWAAETKEPRLVV